MLIGKNYTKQQINSIVKRNKNTFKTHFKFKVSPNLPHLWLFELRALNANSKINNVSAKNSQIFNINTQNLQFIQFNIREQSLALNSANNNILLQGYNLFLMNAIHLLLIYFQKTY